MGFRRTFRNIAIIVIPLIVLAAIGFYFPNPNNLAVYVTAAGVVVSVITYFYQREQLKSRTLLEVFKDFNLPSHREARRITYAEEEESDASYELLGIRPPTTTEEREVRLKDLKRVSENIVRGDLNNAGTLIWHGLMDESVFLDEYWWIILRIWDKSKDSIEERRHSGTGALSYMRNFKELNSKAEKYARKHFPKDFEEYVKKYRSDAIDRASKYFDVILKHMKEKDEQG